MRKAFLFPGQGSQYAGMGKDLYNQIDSAKRLYQTASDILEFNLADISFSGSENQLKQTQFTQPAIFVHSVIIDKYLKGKGILPDAVAGHSLGEFSALVSAEVLSFENAVTIVKVRSEAMANAGKITPGAMAAVIGADDQQLNIICNQDGVVVPANINAPGQVVISGETDAVNKAVQTAKELGIRRALLLNVSGAFHSPLMKPVREPLSEVINSVNFNDAQVPIFQNVNGKSVRASQIIQKNILDQLENPVLWSDIILNMKSTGITDYFETGPGKVLKGLNLRIYPESNTYNFGKLEQLETCEV